MNKVRNFPNEKWIQIPVDYPKKRCSHFISNYGRIKSIDRVTLDEKT